MKEENYEVVVFQGDPGTIDLTYEEIEAEWNKMLQTVPQIGKFRIIHQEKKRYTFEDYSSQIGNADAALGIWVHKGVINEKLFEAHPNLKYIATLGHGFEDFDVEMTSVTSYLTMDSIQDQLSSQKIVLMSSLRR